MSNQNLDANKAPQNSKEVLVDPDTFTAPQTVEDFQRRGYAYYARGRYPEAEADFKNAISMDAKAVDALYALGMVQKAAKQNDESVKTFEQAISLIDQGVIDNRARAQMLRRMAVGHINEITKGDWDLEKEMFKRKK